ncbi:unnamed protein product [Pleuronectes platessa]|uniref:Uncharacterized protein n=1 Tax=Pleuronectes platessa TaxID=8262 RepID=A0A9N7V4G1_PLEPL|nr:unnamed protein product [Pleuronectes platessa]
MWASPEQMLNTNWSFKLLNSELMTGSDSRQRCGLCSPFFTVANNRTKWLLAACIHNNRPPTSTIHHSQDAPGVPDDLDDVTHDFQLLIWPTCTGPGPSQSAGQLDPGEPAATS